MRSYFISKRTLFDSLNVTESEWGIMPDWTKPILTRSCQTQLLVSKEYSLWNYEFISLFLSAIFVFPTTLIRNSFQTSLGFFKIKISSLGAILAESTSAHGLKSKVNSYVARLFSANELKNDSSHFHVKKHACF